MRGLPVLAALLLLTGCNKDQSANVSAEDANLVSDSLRGNDITAIDAATNDSANMAADVDFSLNEANLAGEDENAAEADKPETNEAE